ncbi:MAG: VanW family protein [Fimbriimonadaceae bacterium]|nr:VanW family protein [Fimbriimonadaceae bacterium]
MKKLLIIVGGLLVISGSALSIMAARYEPVFRPNIKIGPVDVGGLTPGDAAKKLRQWWETERVRPIALKGNGLLRQPEDSNWTRLGLGIDDLGSIKQVPVEEFWDNVQRNVGLEEAPTKNFELIYTYDPSRLAPLAKFVRMNSGNPEPAKVSFDWKTKGIRTTPERSVLSLELSQMQGRVMEALAEQANEIELPLAEAPKKMSDAMLAKMATVQSEFSTRFPTSKRTRCENIKLASAKINGLILMPGEDFKFNTVVGKRTIEAGFKVAGVYKNGKHDTDVGGGICQVSTTLYGAALRSNLKIKRRSNHSLPISYVPLGLDATVDYNSHDLVFTNSMDHPIAIFSKYEPGKLSFAIVGQKLPYTVKLTSQRTRSWGNGTQYVHDGSLPFGKQKVIERGGGGSAYVAYRILVQDGKEIKRERLIDSNYRGGPRIVAVNKNAAKPVSAPKPSVGSPLTPPSVAPVSTGG